MENPVPTVGRIVLYKLAEYDVERIEKLREYPNREKYVGSSVSPGMVFPLLITAVLGNDPNCAVNGTVFLDGPDSVWCTGRYVGTTDGTYSWPVRV